jgi:hypothetical protein
MSPRNYIMTGLLPNPCCGTCDKRVAKIQHWISTTETPLQLDNLRDMCANHYNGKPDTLRKLLGLCNKREGELQAKAGGAQYDDVAKGEEDPNDLYRQAA